MPVTVIVGGQFGSEGKGKIAHYLSRSRETTVVARGGGPNSGHTAVDVKGRTWVFRQLPTGCLHEHTVSVLGPGAVIDTDLLLDEIEAAGLEPGRVVVDPNATVLGAQHRQTEHRGGLVERIGSTGAGVGAARISRLERMGDRLLAKSDQRLTPYLGDTIDLLSSALERGQRVLLEGCQGFGLSLFHSSCYPFATSRDTTAAAVLSELGLSPLTVDEVVLVIRSFPIRVGGNSGPLANEIDWQTVTAESGSATPLSERTTVTNRLRRVARFDPGIVRRAIASNRPTTIALNHLDYIDSARRIDRIRDFVESVEYSIDHEITYLGFSPDETVLRLALGRISGAARFATTLPLE